MRRAAFAAVLLAAGACTGLLVDKGNDYPCDFRAPEAERDLACSPSEVCGVDNRCRPFHYEGPQFEGRPGLPRFDSATRLHPGQLSDDVRALALNGNLERSGALGGGVDRSLLVVTEGAGGPKAWKVDLAETGVRVTALNFDVPDKLLGLAHVDSSRSALVVRDNLVQTTTQQVLGAAAPATVSDTNSAVRNIAELRTRFGALWALRGPGNTVAGYSAGIITGADAGVANRFVPVNTGVRLEDGGTGNTGLSIYDLALAPPRSFGQVGLLPPPVPVALTADGLYFQSEGTGQGTGDWVSLHPDPLDQQELGDLGGPFARLRSDPSGSLWAVSSGFGQPGAAHPPLRTLSTWNLDRTGPGEFAVSRAWPDCTPCGNALIGAFAPSVEGFPEVEVVCLGGKGKVNPVRVLGSIAADPSQACISESFDLPVDVSRIGSMTVSLNGTVDATLLVQDQSLNHGVVVGGERGRLYLGTTFSRVRPLFLDRLPSSTGTFPLLDGGAALVALTDGYTAVRLGTEGFEFFDLARQAAVPLDGVVPAALVGEAPGWTVLSSGDVARARAIPPVAGKAFALDFGPRLLDTRDRPAEQPYFAEAVAEVDGGTRALVLTAFDSLYLSRDDVQATLSDSPGVVPPLRPDLTPEPNSPIRSFALERSALGTDGRGRVRGYVATARNLYLVEYGDTPPRWTATPLVLTGESPVEVWMDHPRGGLGRVGYPSGEVYTLPGAFLLARSLEASGVLDGVGEGVQVDVDDYENFAGWPAAYSRAGVFVADYDLLPDGGLDNKKPDGGLGKPMTWKRAQLADGGEPWLDQPGRLQVTRGPRVASGSNYTEEWTLVVFTADEAWEVGHTTRTNAR